MEGSPNSDWSTMWSMFVIAMLGGMVGLVLFELVEEVRGGSDRLHDRYHE